MMSRSGALAQLQRRCASSRCRLCCLRLALVAAPVVAPLLGPRPAARGRTNRPSESRRITQLLRPGITTRVALGASRTRSPRRSPGPTRTSLRSTFFPCTTNPCARVARATHYLHRCHQHARPLTQLPGPAGSGLRRKIAAASDLTGTMRYAAAAEDLRIVPRNFASPSASTTRPRMPLRMPAVHRRHLYPHDDLEMSRCERLAATQRRPRFGALVGDDPTGRARTCA